MKKVLSTIGMAVVLAGSTTFANAGIIVAGKGATTPTGCTSRDGIIVAGRDGIIVAGRDGIIVAGKDLVGIIVAGITGVTVVGDDPCGSMDRDGIIITD